MPFVPAGRSLVGVPEAAQGLLRQASTHKLERVRTTIIGEPTRHGQGWRAGEVRRDGELHLYRGEQRLNRFPVAIQRRLLDGEGHPAGRTDHRVDALEHRMEWLI